MDKIVILDFGSQYSHLICRRIREANIYCEIHSYEIKSSELEKMNPKGIIFSGGPASVYQENAPKPDKNIFNLGIPILGICYGHQILVDTFNGKVKKSSKREYGRADLNIDDKTDLFKDMNNKINCWMSHSDVAETIPKGFRVIAHTENSSSAAIANKDKRFYGLQFHPEVVHTERGTQILNNFSTVISKANPDWNMENFIKNTIATIKKQVKDDRVICAVSGGIDSTTVATLLNKSIGKNLSCVFVNHGLLRLEEEKIVMTLLQNKLKINVRYIDAQKRFLTKLHGVADPEKKRKIIGKEFIKIFTEFAKKEGPFDWLAQGTLYPDIIESGVSKGPASIIKSHHNVGGLPKKLGLKLLEPLKDLYKDEVKKVASIMNIPKDLLQRHPFPGPGLAVRIIGELNDEKIRICKYSSQIVEDELKSNNLYHKVWQAYAAVGDDKAVGVVGDERLYGYIVTVRIVDSIDAMTADWTKLPHSLMTKISDRITNEVNGVSWVTYAISSKPPATIEPQ